MYSTLISAEQLKDQFDAENWLILDCRFDLFDVDKGEQLYRDSHIPNAIYLNLNQQLAGQVTANTGRHPLPEISAITQLFSSIGIADKKQIIVYDDCSGAMAARAWWLLQWLGHTQVAVLDGGINAWTERELSLTAQINTPKPAHFVRHASDFKTVTTEQICSGNYQLVDARAAGRFRGEVEPIDPVAGHIPDAVNHPFMENLTAQGLFKTTADLQALWSPLVQQNTTHMCGSGVTACHNILAMCHAGFEPTHLYVGSWSEWIRDSARPVSNTSSVD
ncbi:MAG: hypothetical protein OFPII_42870 [Osedax symbiont Rs1]|nr:MAG: hypothetical protein OFPII_42870 [Osedax symbiont Rs1]